MAELVDRVFVDIDGEEIEATSVDEKISGNKEVVKVMNRRNRAIGHHHGIPEFLLTVTFPNDLDIATRFTRMLKSNTRFTTTTVASGEDGTEKNVSYLDCEIYDVDSSGKEGSNQEITVEIGALDSIDS